MYKLKQFIAGTFMAAIILATPAAAQNQIFHGTVTLPTSITNLLDTCSGEECPSININLIELFGDYSSSYNGGSVDYNGTSGQYEYSLELIRDEYAPDDYSNNYQVFIDIRNGDMGNETLYYNFGSDRAIGTTGDIYTIDSILHQDELYSGLNILYDLNLPLSQINTQLDIDLTNKNDGRQKVTGKIKLPTGLELGQILDDNGTQVGYNDVSVNIHTLDYSTSSYLWINDGVQDVDGLYTFTSSINNESNVDLNLSLELSATLDGHQINTYYQIGVDSQDVDDHSIDGDEKLVTGWNPYTNYVTFSSTIIDFGTLDVDAYLVGSQILTGSFTPPESFPIYNDQNGSNSIFLSFSSFDYADFWFSSYIFLDGYNTSAPENGIYNYDILIPQDIQGKIEDNNLSVSIEFSSSDYITNDFYYENKYYSFGIDQQVDDTDHILEGTCVNPSDAKPLTLDFSTTLPVVDINISNYVLPNTSKVELTFTVPASLPYTSMMAIDLSCDTAYGNGYSYDNADGTITTVAAGLLEGHEYGFEVSYETGSWELGTSEYHSFMLNGDDGDFTNGGNFLDTLVWDEITGTPIFDQTYVATESDVVFSPVEIVLPTRTEVSPAVIMYLLN